MKTCFLFLAVTLTCLSFTGCAFMNDEDREFYGKGWVHPSELDDVAPKHDPAATAAAASGADYRPAATSTSHAQQPAPEWIVPETSDNNQ